MQPFQSSFPENSLKLPLLEGAQPSVLVGLATVPYLGFVLLNRTANHWIHQIGVASEEIFRGERLPVINAPLDPSD